MKEDVELISSDFRGRIVHIFMFKRQRITVEHFLDFFKSLSMIMIINHIFLPLSPKFYLVTHIIRLDNYEYSHIFES